VWAALWSGSGTLAGSEIQQTHTGVRGFGWSGRIPKSIQRSSLVEPRYGRESIVHSYTQFWPSIERPFPHPDSTDRPFPNPYPAKNPPLSSFLCFILTDLSPFSPVNLGSTGSTGRASTELVSVVVGRWVGFSIVSGFNRPATGGENRSGTVTVGEKGHFCRTPHQFVNFSL